MSENVNSSGQVSIVMYSTRFCPYCIGAKRLLASRNLEYTDIAVDGEPALRQEMMQRSGQRTVPQIWIGEEHVGGYTDLYALEQSGELDNMLAAGQA